ncbi:MAG: hypothetical protein ABI182_06195 [Candidatus Baltobacteraceae bacterium]
MNKQQLFVYMGIQLVLIGIVLVNLTLNELVHSWVSAAAIFLSAAAALLMAIANLIETR